MKKFKIVAGSLLAVVLLTGCGTKTLTCTQSLDSFGLTMDQEIKIEVKGKKVTKVKVSVDSKATDDEIKENWDMYASIFDSQFGIEEEEGVEFTTENNKEKYFYKVSIELDLDKASEETLSNYSFDGIKDKKVNLEDIKKEIEESGYTCK